MKPPRRLLDDRITPDERRALNAGLSLAAPAANKQRIWASVSAGLATGVSVAAAQLAAGGSAATSQLGSPAANALTSAAPLAGAGVAAGKAAPLGLTLAKTLLTWTLLGSALGVGAKLALEQAPKVGVTLTPQARTAAPTQQAPATLTTSTANARGALVLPLANGDGAKREPSDAEPRSPEPKPRASSKPIALPVPSPGSDGSSANAVAGKVGRSLALEQESRLVARARTLLRSGQPHACLSLLAQVDSQFHEGWLQQERRALAIEARVALGQRAEARRLTRDFERDYPESPYASKVSEMAR